MDPFTIALIWGILWTLAVVPLTGILIWLVVAASSALAFAFDSAVPAVLGWAIGLLGGTAFGIFAMVQAIVQWVAFAQIAGAGS